MVAIVKKALFTFFRCRFTVDVPGPDDLEAQGDLGDAEYEVTTPTAGRAPVTPGGGRART